MNATKKVTALVGSYRRGGIIDQTTDEILLGAREAGAETEKIVLLDKRIEFCTNCRACTQQPSERRGECVIADDMKEILDILDSSDALILATPLNYWTVSAVFKRFIERTVCYAYWPWGKHAPAMRSKKLDKVAVVVVSSAAPSFLVGLMSNIVRLMKSYAKALGAKPIGALKVGMIADKPDVKISARVRAKANALGRKLVERSK
jgi:multimeric flavodoxin WrbA